MDALSWLPDLLAALSPFLFLGVGGNYGQNKSESSSKSKGLFDDEDQAQISSDIADTTKRDISSYFPEDFGFSDEEKQTRKASAFGDISSERQAMSRRAQENAVSRGLSGSGIEASDLFDVDAQALAAAGRASTGIELADAEAEREERDKRADRTRTLLGAGGYESSSKGSGMNVGASFGGS